MKTNLLPEHDRLVDVRLPEPGFLVSTGEYLDGDVLAPPVASPHLAVPPLTHTLHQRHLNVLTL